MLDEVQGTLVGRWYVSLFGIAFVVLAIRDLGWRRTALFVLASLGIGLLAENASVHFGIPYTRYEFEPGLRGEEVWVGDVPIMVPLSYGFMVYFAFAAGRLLATGPHHTRAARRWHEWLLAEVLAVWALWGLDPMSQRGARFYLGELFSYDGPGFWFGLPLGSQVGFALTAAVQLAVLFAMTRHEPDRRLGSIWQHPGLPAIVVYQVQVFHLVAIAFWLGGADLHRLGGAALLVWFPVAALTAVHWSGLAAVEQARSESRADGVPVPASVPLR